MGIHDFHRRPTAATRAVDPAPTEALTAREGEMAEVVREIYCRDGHVTEAALISAGFTAAEIVEFGARAVEAARLRLTICGADGDRLPAIIERAREAVAGAIPSPAATPVTAEMQVAWRRYCCAVAACRLDPWIAQRERCIAMLLGYLMLLPLLPRERNAVIAAVSGALPQGRSL